MVSMKTIFKEENKLKIGLSKIYITVHVLCNTQLDTWKHDGKLKLVKNYKCIFLQSKSLYVYQNKDDHHRESFSH